MDCIQVVVGPDGVKRAACEHRPEILNPLGYKVRVTLTQHWGHIDNKRFWYGILLFSNTELDGCFNIPLSHPLDVKNKGSRKMLKETVKNNAFSVHIDVIYMYALIKGRYVGCFSYLLFESFKELFSKDAESKIAIVSFYVNSFEYNFDIPF